MIISRLNQDFGNSVNNVLADRYYFEFPTVVVELTKERAEKVFVDAIENPHALLKNLLISTTINDEEKYYLVGEAAAKHPLANMHVDSMHNKITSHIPYVSFLGAVAYYHALKTNQKDEESTENIVMEIVSDITDNEVEIEYMSMMLPIWVLQKEAKFSIAQRLMEERFTRTEHTVSIHTPGMKRELKIKVNQADCRIESEVARYAIKYRLVKKDDAIVLEKRKIAERFENSIVNLIDIGGGSTDVVTLGPGLTAPRSRDAFKVIDIEPFLGYLEQFRKEKLLDVFDSLRLLESFIVANYKNDEYKLVNANTGATKDFTALIKEMLNDYAELFVNQLIRELSKSTELMNNVYFGGEADILEPYIKSNLLNHMSKEIAESNHFFLSDIIKNEENELDAPTSRTINLNALELLSIEKTKTVKS
ncbi:hypothetical protein ACIGHG_23400 [Bacillus sp. NPDC077411]|uniref:Alp7A family actin-like protein n=1 Tax=Bacillus sp. NPDC077411 TaxID=3363947 RepID=UPI0037C6404D